MAKDFADINRLEHEAGIQAPEAGGKQELTNKFVKAWENQTTRRAVKGGVGMTMALTLAACGSDSDDDGDGVDGGDDGAVTVVGNLFAMVSDGITVVAGADPIVTVPNPTAGADELATTITGDATGTLELRFDDAEDVVALGSASDLSGYDTLAITAGTVDVTAVDLSDIGTISVSSGVTLTAAQFLALENGVTGGSDESTVTIIVSTVAEAADVIAAVSSLNGTFNSVSFDSDDLSPIILNAQNEALEGALEAAAIANALPAAVATLLEAQEDLSEFLQEALENEDVVEALVEEPADATDGQIVTAIGGAIEAAAKVLDDEDITGEKLTDGQRSANIDAKRVELAESISGAEGAVAVARKAVVDDEDLDVVVADLTDAAAEKVMAAMEAEEAALAAYEDLAPVLDKLEEAIDKTLDGSENPGFELNYSAAGLPQTVTYGTETIIIVADGELVIAAGVRESEDGESWVMGGIEDGPEELVLPKAEVADLIAAAQIFYNKAVEAVEAGAEAEAAFAKLLENLDLEPNSEETLTWPDDVPDVVEGYYNAQFAEAEANATSEAFEDALASWTALNDLAEQAADLQDAIQDALEAISDAPDDGLGINIVGLGGDDSSAASDLFVIDDEHEEDEHKEDVPIVGTDFLVFDFGTTFTFVELGEDDVLFDGGPGDDTDFGSVSTREIFAQESGNDVVLYIENVVTAGNGTTGADFTEVTLTNVTLDDVSFDSTSQILTAEASTLV